MNNAISYKSDFPVLTNNSELVYLDSASTTLVPRCVIDAMNNYYQTIGANVHRGLYKESAQATEAYEQARKIVADFIHAKEQEIIFTSGTTASLNMAARLLEEQVQTGDEIVLTRLEHHANLIPWQELAQRTGAVLRYIELDDDFHIDYNSIQHIIGEKTKIIAFSVASNALGTIVFPRELVRLAKKYNAYTVVDAAQYVAHKEVFAHEWDVDFISFSGHKIYGPTGIGVLYGKAEMLSTLKPVTFGGEAIREVTYEHTLFADAPYKFEPGTPPIAEAIGLAAAITYIQSIGFDAIYDHEVVLMDYALQKLWNEVEIIGPKGNKRVPVFSFTLGDAHPHDVADILAREHIAVRAGHHCAQPLMNLLQIPGTVRASFGIYNTKEDIDMLISGIEKAKHILKV